MKKAYYFVYVTTNLETGKKYVGQHCTYDLEDNYLGSNSELLEDIFKYKEYSFKRKIIEYAEDIYDLSNKELFWINKFNAVENPLWYNRSYSCSPNSFFGKTHKEDTKRKLSKCGGNKKGHRRLKRDIYPEHGHRKGVKLTEEHKIRIGVSHTGPGNGFWGKTHTEEVKNHIREIKTGLKQSEETIQLRVNKLKGQKRSEETKKLMSEKQKEVWQKRKNK